MNSTLSPHQLLHALNWRYATKIFDPAKKISTETWSVLEESLVLTPSSYGLQPWKFLVVQNPALRESLVPHSWGQRQVADASHLVVFAVFKTLTPEHINSYLQRISDVRGVAVDVLEPLKKMIHSEVMNGPRSAIVTEWAVRQAYIALGNFMTAAALLGVDTCPMEGFVADKYDEILGLSARNLTAAVVCPAGYRASTDKYADYKKVRFPKEQVVEVIS